MEKVINELVRDKIPEVIENNGEIPVFRILRDDNEYRIELMKKLKDKSSELAMTTNSIEVLQELADILEVIRALAKLESKSFENVVALAAQKQAFRGGFDKRIFLERTIQSEGETR